MANDSKLIGYFYIDCPTWLHVRDINKWKGPLFDEKKLKSKAGREELTALTAQYYKVTHDAVRRYDPNHLILGDRYEANAPLTMDIIEGARPYVDVLSFQDFQDPVGHLEYWHKESGMRFCGRMERRVSKFLMLRVLSIVASGIGMCWLDSAKILVALGHTCAAPICGTEYVAGDCWTNWKIPTRRT